MADFGRQLADLLYGESQQPQDPKERQRIARLIDTERLRRLAGAGETAATFGTGLAASVPAGLAGLAQMMPTRGRAPDVNRAAQRVEDVQGALTYLPRTETGQRYLENTAGALEMLGAPAEYLGEKALQYTGSPAAATATNVLLDPVNFIGMPGSGKALKVAGKAAMAAPRVAGDILSEALMPASRIESQRGAIKMKGGNWLAGEVEDATAPLKSRGPTQADRDWILQHAENQRELGQDPTRILQGLESIPRTEALNNWIDKKLNRYIKNEMGTPEDPIRKLAEQGILHFEPEAHAMIRGDAENRRALGPFGQMGQSRLAKAWEDLSDLSIIPDKARDFQEFGSERHKAENPWLAKVSPEADIYSTGSMGFEKLGFDHLIDVLKEDLATGRIRPEQLEKMSMEQAVRRAHEYNEEAAKKAADTTAAIRSDLPVYKEYPQGYRWVELNKPGAFAAESDAMGHSVRGYEPPKGHPDWVEGSGEAGSPHYGHGGWEAIKSGKTKVYSLVDAKGQPHVTIEVLNKFSHPSHEKVIEEMRRSVGDIDSLKEYEYEAAYDAAFQRAKNLLPAEITQIKGKQNRAPKEDYLSFVQDFVRSGQWSDVRDFQNTGFISTQNSGNLPSALFKDGRLDPKFYDIDPKKVRERLGDQKYVTEQEWMDAAKDLYPDLFKEGKAKGGSVRISDNPDTMRLELATGGAVKAAAKAAKTAAKAAKEEKLSVPYNIPRAPAKTKEEIRPIAQRMAEQMTGEFVRPDLKISKNPAGKTYQQFLMERELEGHHQYRKTKDVPEPEVADIEKQEGMVKFGISGDTTMADTELLRAGPYQMEDPVPLHGGPRFPLGGEGAWASNNPIAANVQRRIGEMSQFFDAPVLGQYMAMGPSGSMFAQHLADANLQAIDLSKMTKRQIEQFNKLIREGNEKSGPRPTFPGIQDKNEAYLWMAFDPKLRIHFNELMQKPTVTGALNLPDGRIILDAITEPELRNKEIMTSGLSQFQFDPNVRPEDLPLSMHPTYTHLIPMKQGAPVTRTRYPTPAELEFPDVTNFIRQNYRPQDFVPTFQKSSPRQKIDQQAIDEIRMFEELMKEYTGKKKGGAVKKATGGAIKAAAKAAEKAAKPSAEQAAKLAALREKMVPRAELAKKIMEENLDKPLSEIEEGGLTKALQALPKKKGGKVKFTNNLDAMRLALKK